MKTSNIVIIVGMLIAMGAIAIGASKVKLRLEESIIQPTGNIVEKTYDLAAFSKINLRDNIECTLVKADEQMVKVEMDEAWVDRLSVKVSEDEFLGFDVEGFGKKEQIKVTIHYTDLSQLTVKSARCTGEIVTDSLTHLYVIDGANLNASMDTKYCNLLMQSGSQANLSGICTSLRTQSESGSMLFAEKLMVEKCIAIVESGAKSELSVSTKLNATAKNGGSISYKGSPEVKELVESGGTVSKEEEGSAL
jgi:hypothetical protein|tara:strand:+ start:2448 stop:3197 length:750 start_codon:yes stop_codon:yes gene_type:complete